MVFSSFQAYLDSSNWQQPPPSSTYQGSGTVIGAGGANLLTPPPPQLQPPPSQPLSHGGSIRPGSMADRARLANIPMPETALKCPRCESTNTKFCYFNNYSLTQPRHFCKTCRRYWTRGGALRNVPVGGGCRRNKRTKSNTNNSTSNTATATTTTTTSTSLNSTTNMAAAMGSTSTIGAILGGQHESFLSQVFPPVRLMGPYFHHLNNEPSAADNPPTGIGLLNYGGDLGSVQIGSPLAAAGGGGSLLSSFDQWKLASQPQLPALGVGNLDSSGSSGFYPFELGNTEQSGPKISSSSISSALATQLASVKVEDNPYKCLSWTDLSSFGSSSSAGNPL